MARAKLNLCLRITGRRNDGYHFLESVLHEVEWGDELVFDYEPRQVSSTHLCVKGAELPDGPQNLAYQAVELLRERAGLTGRVCIELRKRVPVGAGLGGGSADAGAVLRTVNELAGLQLGLQQLQELGSILGSDVPFAVTGGAVLAQGVGQHLTRLSSSLQLPVLLVHPPRGLSTPVVYRWWDEHQTAGETGERPYAGASGPLHETGKPAYPDTARLIRALHDGEAVDWESLLINDLETVVCQQVPAVSQALGILRDAPGVLGCAMTGSGSTVFALLDPDRPTTAVEAVPDEYESTLTRLSTR